MQYALFLRGINVGPIKVPMPELIKTLSALGLGNVKTVAQTGNVLFSSKKTGTELKPELEKALSTHFHYTAHVLLYPASILNEIIATYPFPPQTDQHRYVLFCETPEVVKELMENAPSLNPDIERISTGSSWLYWLVPKGSTTKSDFAQLIAKPRYKATTTNRNLNTLEKMLELSRN